MRKARYIPKNIFQKSPPASRLMLSLYLNVLYCVCGLQGFHHQAGFILFYSCCKNTTVDPPPTQGKTGIKMLTNCICYKNQ